MTQISGTFPALTIKEPKKPKESIMERQAMKRTFTAGKKQPHSIAERRALSRQKARGDK